MRGFELDLAGRYLHVKERRSARKYRLTNHQRSCMSIFQGKVCLLVSIGALHDPVAYIRQFLHHCPGPRVLTRYIHALTCPRSLYPRQATSPLIETSSHVSSTTTTPRAKYIAMILRVLFLIVATVLLRGVRADVAPEITTLAEGYNIVAKLPCVGCPFLYQDSRSGVDEGWKVREDENALVSTNM